MVVLTKKFSEFADGGNLENSNITVGLEASSNAQFNNPWTFLPPGNTGDRPAIAPSMYDRLRFNTTFQEYEYYNSGTSSWVQLNNTGTISGPFVIYEADPSIPAAFNLGTLTTGLLKQTVSLGVATPATALLDTDYYGPTMSGYMQAPAGIKDGTGAIVFANVAILNAVNYLTFSNQATGLSPVVSVGGVDADIGIALRAKNAGQVSFETVNTVRPFVFKSGTTYLHETNFIMANTNHSVDVTWQDLSGTVAYLADIPAGSPSALSEVNDTNVTMVLSGTPLTALLQPVTMTLGWTGTLALTRGGSGASLTASNGGIVYSTASAMAILSGTATANLPLLSGSNAAPSWGAFALFLGGALITAGALTTAGAFGATFTFTNTTSVTFPTSGTLATTAGTVSSVSGTANRITSTGGTTPVIDISAAYVGQTSITTIGTIGTGTWQGTVVGSTYGGTGVNNGASTITLGGSLTTSGAFASTFTMTGVTNVTFPTSGTLLTSAGAVTSIAGTANQIAASASVGAVTLSIVSNPILPGTGGMTFPSGNTAARAGGAGTMRFNSQTSVFECTVDGAAWSTVETAATGVTSVSGTANRITSTGGTTPVIDISAAYVGQTSITTLGTIGTGTWQGTVVGSTYGGTGVNNGSSTITIGGSHTLSGAFASTFTFTNTTSVTFPTSGTLATTSQIPTGAALTKTDDTNVTLTLGGSPTTALINAASLTLGWTGQLGLTRGGSNASLTASNGGIVYSTASAFAILAGTATAGQMLQSGASTTPGWSTSTYPATNAVSTLLYASSANVMAALATANSSILVTNSSGVPAWGTTLPAFTTSAITFSPTTGGIVGTTTNDDAAAGKVGEFITATTSTVSITSSSAKTITSISLTAGDWDVWCSIRFTPAGTTVPTAFQGCVSSTNNATEVNSSFIVSQVTSFPTGTLQYYSMAPVRKSLSGTTTIYAVALSVFTVSTMTADAIINARRVR